MSGHSVSVSFTRAAQDDWDDILFVSQARWGQDQARAYEQELVQAISHIAQFPEIGRSVDYIYPGCRCIGAGVHIMYYTLDRGAIIIHRILHERRHVSRDLFESD
jgi:plasmid stabilization system protein ParE